MLELMAAPGEWMLHHQAVQKNWSVFWKAEVDLFGVKCQIFLSNQQDALAYNTPFALIAVIHQVIRQDEILAPLCDSTVEEPDVIPGSNKTDFINLSGRLKHH